MWLLDGFIVSELRFYIFVILRKRGANQSIFFIRGGSIDTLINIVDQNQDLQLFLKWHANLSEEQRKYTSFKNSTPVREISLVTRREFIRERLIDVIVSEVKEAVPLSLQDEAMKKYVVPL